LSIKRLYLRELLSFDEVTLEFDPGLIVLTGPSGAGKSILMQSVLANFGYDNSEAKLCEITMTRPAGLQSESYALEEELVIRSIRKDRTRFYLNEQSISKKALRSLFASSVQYLSVRDKGELESDVLLKLLDRSRSAKERDNKKLLKEYRKRYITYRMKVAELEKIREEEHRLAELIEFTTYEIEKIRSIDPKVGEDEELMHIKQQLSRIDKIDEALNRASVIFDSEASVYELFRLLERDSSYVTDTMNQLRADFEESRSFAEELSDIDVEAVLDRLEKLSSLKKRYGSLAEALEYMAEKEKELQRYRRSEQDKSMLESYLALESSELMILAQRISSARRQQAQESEAVLKRYLEELKLPAARFMFDTVTLGESGIDRVDLLIGDSSTSTLSGGEFNRLRLALLLVSMDLHRKEGGVIILDEIDANVSGDESIAIAAMISRLSAAYQIFAISHQSHLSAQADQHILVTKRGGVSQAHILDDEERITEIARIIGGEKSADEAVAFAEKLRRSKTSSKGV